MSLMRRVTHHMSRRLTSSLHPANRAERPCHHACIQQKSQYSCQSENEVKLFTPGPLNTSPTVKAAMLKDLGSRDSQFLDIIKFIRAELLRVADVSAENYTAVPMQGSGTFTVEATIQTSVPRSKHARMLVLSGGAYGERIAKICSYLSIPHDVLRNPEDAIIDLQQVKSVMSDTKYSNVSVVHSETSSGVINPVIELGQLIKQSQPDCSYMIDAMSSLGGVTLDWEASNADFIVSSANKCVQGVPGFGFVIAKLNSLLQCQGNSRSLSLDLYDQFAGLEKTGMFRFTPPTHTLLAFQQALHELEQEGGVTGRAERYTKNNTILREGMKRLGFTELISPDYAGYIITSFRYPESENFSFEVFYNKLKDKGQVLYPGKMVDEDCFRIGNIGDLHPKDMAYLLLCITEVCTDMKVF